MFKKWFLLILFLLLILYPLRLAREQIQSLFVVGVEDQTNWDLILAERRFKETRFLEKYHLSFLSQPIKIMGKYYLTQASTNLVYLSNKVNTNYLLDKRQMIINGNYSLIYR